MQLCGPEAKPQPEILHPRLASRPLRTVGFFKRTLLFVQITRTTKHCYFCLQHVNSTEPSSSSQDRSSNYSNLVIVLTPSTCNGAFNTETSMAPRVRTLCHRPPSGLRVSLYLTFWSCTFQSVLAVLAYPSTALFARAACCTLQRTLSGRDAPLCSEFESPSTNICQVQGRAPFRFGASLFVRFVLSWLSVESTLDPRSSHSSQRKGTLRRDTAQTRHRHILCTDF